MKSFQSLRYFMGIRINDMRNQFKIFQKKNNTENHILSLSLLPNVKHAKGMIQIIDDITHQGLSEGTHEHHENYLRLSGMIDPSNYDLLEDPPSVSFFIPVSLNSF
jgi:DNA replication protein DnaD